VRYRALRLGFMIIEREREDHEDQNRTRRRQAGSYFILGSLYLVCNAITMRRLGISFNVRSFSVTRRNGVMENRQL